MSTQLRTTHNVGCGVAGAVTSAQETDRSAPLGIVASPGPAIGSLCTGYGGLDLGVLTALGGGRIVWCADPDPHITTILAARVPGVPNLGDLRTIDWTRVKPVDVVTAGFPCQDISAAGRRVGIEKGKHSGLWTDIVAGVRVLRSALLIVENVAALRWRNGGLHRVLGDLAEAGYDAFWRSVRAADIGATHRRERVFLLAWPQQSNQHTREGDPGATDVDDVGSEAPPPSSGRVVAARPGAVTADATPVGHGNDRPTGGRRLPAAAVPAGTSACRATVGPAGTIADTSSDRRDEGQPCTAGIQGRPDAALGNQPSGNQPNRRRHPVAADPTATAPSPAGTTDHGGIDWGDYAAAIHRWERVLGRRTPWPTQPGRHGRSVLAPPFVEHRKGLPPGWVTDLNLPRTAQLRALGNGVVPQQAAHAITLLLTDLHHLTRGTPTCDAGGVAPAVAA